MKFVVAVSLFVLCARPCAAARSPVEKVVHLLTDLQEKIKADGANEKAVYEKYSCWCTGMTRKKGAAIEQAKKDLTRLGSEIMALKGDVATYSSDINDAAKDMQDNHDDQQKATKTRDLENAAFTATRGELSQALGSLGQALKMLKMAPQFLQTGSLSTQAAEAVRTAIEAIPDKSLGSLPAAKLAQIQQVSSAVASGKYDPSYGSLTTILDEMNSIFTDDLKKETETEKKSYDSYEGLMQTKVKELIALQNKVDKREASKADAAADLADTTQNYDDTESQMNADIEFFGNAVDSCEKKAKAWETRTDMRDEELKGIAKAIEILTGDDARELFGKAINAGARTSFLQVAEADTHMSPDQQKAFNQIKTLATRSQSVALAKIAAQVRLAQGGHFDAVLGAIDKVIGVLETEQEEDNDKKTQCKEEYQKVAKVSSDLEWKIEKNEAKIDKLETIIANKEEEKAATIQSIDETKQEIKDMTAERKAAKEDFDEALLDDQNAVKLLNSAKDALNAFYKKHGHDEAKGAFVQEPKFDRGDDAPETADFSDAGSRAGQTKGVNMLLSTIIEGLEVEIKVQTQVEKDSVASFKKALKAAQDLQKKLETKETNLKKEIADRNKDKDDENKDKDDNTADLKDETDYKAKIQPDCDFMLNSWQERFNKRKAEMDGLKTAKDFLSGAALVQTKQHHF